MSKLSQFAISITTVLALSACGGGSSSGGNSNNGDDSLAAMSCTGNRIWDFGESDFVVDATSYISETNGQTQDSKFPCAVFWEYQPVLGCSLAFNYEAWLTEFDAEDILQTLGTSGANLVAVSNEGVRATGAPAGISITDLSGLPDCVFE